jgi:1-deoxy-D-xylulose-5-phosphate synthase
LIVEENSPGGFSAHVLQYLANAGHLDQGLRVRALSIPDEFIDHDSQAGQLAYCGLDRNGILAAAQTLVAHASNAIAGGKS